MDTSYKLADHHPVVTLLQNFSSREFGFDDTRSYVGPKGWVISRSEEDKKWRMEHQSYPELTLTMLDIDPLPIGKKMWKIDNNVCNQGTTNIQSLLISGCKEEEFTCDDGKCLDITQRCNNIEVNKSITFYN